MERRGGRRPAGVAAWHRSARCVCVCFAALLAAGSVKAMTMEVDDGSSDCVFINAKEGSTINANYEILGPPVRSTMVIFRRKEDRQLLYKKQGLAEDYFRTEATGDGDYELCFINGDLEQIERLRNKNPEKGVRMVGLDALRREKKMKLKREKQERADLADDDYSGSYTTMFRSDDDLDSVDIYLGDDLVPWYGVDSRRKTFGFGLRVGDDVDDLASMADISQADRAVGSFLKEEADNLVQSLLFFNDHESFMRGREEFHRENMNQTSSRLMWCTFVEAVVLMWVSWSQLSYIRRFFETKRVL